MAVISDLVGMISTRITHQITPLLLLLLATLLSSCGDNMERGQVSLSSEMGGGDLQSYRLLWNNSSSSSGGPALNVKISSSFLAEEQQIANSMMEEWNNSHAELKFFNTDQIEISDNLELSDVTAYKDNELGIYKSQQWFENVSPAALAITQFFGIRRDVGTIAERVELIHADIIVNYRYFDFSTTNDSNNNNYGNGSYDLASVLLHELGHFLGLAHQSDFYSESIMHPYMSSYDVEQATYPQDRDDLQTNYDIENTLLKSNALMVAALPAGDKKQDKNINSESDQLVYGIFELQSSGKCQHRIKIYPL